MATKDERYIIHTAEVPKTTEISESEKFTELSLGSELPPARDPSRPSRPPRKSPPNSKSPIRNPNGNGRERSTSRNSDRSPHLRETGSSTSFSSGLEDMTQSQVMNGIRRISEQPIRANSEETVPMGAPVSRMELLDIVRKHSHIIKYRKVQQVQQQVQRGQRKKSVSFADDPPSAPIKNGIHNDGEEYSESTVMDSRYWREMLDLYFIKGCRKGRRRGRRADSWGETGGIGGEDILYFVREGEIDDFPPENDEDEEDLPKLYFSRPWDIQLGLVLGADVASIDWRKSFFLNLICQTVFTLTVAVCSRKELEAHKLNSKSPAVIPTQRSTRRVYATPEKSRVDAIEALTEADQCLCVLLNAHSGAAFPESEEPSSGSNSPVFRFKKKGRAKVLEDLTGETPRVTLFSGFVSYAMVKGNFSGFGFWNAEQKPEAERLVMKGPSGRGEAEVTISYAPSRDFSSKTEQLQTLNEPVQSSAEALQRRNGESSRLKELQHKLIVVQEELTHLVTQQQLHSNGMTGESLATKERQYQTKLSTLNERLLSLQTQLQDLQQREPEDETKNESELYNTPLPGGLADFMRRAATAIAPASSPPIICSLRSLDLPWEILAHDLLFKSAPMKVDITGHIFPRLPDRNYY